MRGLQVIFFLIISLFELHAQLEYTLDGRITPEAFDSLVSSGVISEENQGDYTLIYKEKHLLSLENACLFFRYSPDVPAVWYSDILVIPSYHNDNNIQRASLDNIPYNVRKVICSEGVKELLLKNCHNNVEFALPKSLKKFELKCNQRQGYIALPTLEKSGFEFIGWRKQAENSNNKGDGIYYDSVSVAGVYCADLRYLAKDPYSIKYGDIVFDDNHIFSCYLSNVSEVIIPNVIEDEKVLSIGSGAFRNKVLSNVVLPDYLEKIGKQAFSGNDIIDVVFPEQVKNIGFGAFAGNKIQQIHMPLSIDTISAYAFAKNELSEIVFPKELLVIGAGAFRKNKLSFIKFNEKVIYIGIGAFAFNSFNESFWPVLPMPNFEDRSFLYWQSFKKGEYVSKTKIFVEVNVAKCQPGEKMDLELGYKAVFK